MRLTRQRASGSEAASGAVSRNSCPAWASLLSWAARQENAASKLSTEQADESRAVLRRLNEEPSCAKPRTRVRSPRRAAHTCRPFRRPRPSNKHHSRRTLDRRGASTRSRSTTTGRRPDGPPAFNMWIPSDDEGPSGEDQSQPSQLLRVASLRVASFLRRYDAVPALRYVSAFARCPLACCSLGGLAQRISPVLAPGP